MTDTSAAPRLQNARRLTLALIAVSVLFCATGALGAFHFVELFEQEKTAQKSLHEKIQAVMLIQSSVIDLQGFVLGGDSRLAANVSDKASQFQSLQRNHPGDQDFQRMDDAFHIWHQSLAQPMIQKRHEFDTSSLNFSEMGIAYIQGNAPMHERRLEEISTQVLNAAKENLAASQSRISGTLTTAIAVTSALGVAALLLGLLLLKSLRSA
ncbi:MAG: hypothetical protein LAP21_00435 [Acidobacteriia bacterium]|nr:hypothetical protein [Terriglobia bacterium]